MKDVCNVELSFANILWQASTEYLVEETPPYHFEQVLYMISVDHPMGQHDTDNTSLGILLSMMDLIPPVRCLTH
jgi:hypothetical protein